MLIYQAIATWEIWVGEISSKPAVKKNLACLLEGILGTDTAPAGKYIFLTGLMGAGKSTVGAALAKRLGCDFVDVDVEIEKRAGRTIAEIFQQGEDVFRGLESEVLADVIDEVSSGDARIISLGGGALKTPGNLERVNRAGKLVYLEASAGEIVKRLKGPKSRAVQDRPLLYGCKTRGDLEQRISELLAAREQDYKKAGLKINTDGINPDEVADLIVQKLGVK
jgi:shikimate kinase